jgi:hypothetical protein
MNDFERRVRQALNPLSTAFTRWWCHSRMRQAWQRRSESTDTLRREATVLSKHARTTVNDLRDSDAGKRATSALHDLRDSDASKRAAGALNDLRESDAGKRAASALQDLRQSEPVRKAEATARRTLHDLRTGSGSGGDTDSTSTTS